MSIGKRVREARKEAGLTQKQLADKVGVSQAALSELENGDSYGTTRLAAMASVLNVSALWLETGRGQKRQDGMGLSQQPDEQYVDLPIPSPPHKASLEDFSDGELIDELIKRWGRDKVSIRLGEPEK